MHFKRSPAFSPGRFTRHCHFWRTNNKIWIINGLARELLKLVQVFSDEIGVMNNHNKVWSTNPKHFVSLKQFQGARLEKRPGAVLVADLLVYIPACFAVSHVLLRLDRCACFGLQTWKTFCLTPCFTNEERAYWSEKNWTGNIVGNILDENLSWISPAILRIRPGIFPSNSRKIQILRVRAQHFLQCSAPISWNVYLCSKSSVQKCIDLVLFGSLFCFIFLFGVQDFTNSLNFGFVKTSGFGVNSFVLISLKGGYTRFSRSEFFSWLFLNERSAFFPAF